jgi:hypothetical protein
MEGEGSAAGEAASIQSARRLVQWTLLFIEPMVVPCLCREGTAITAFWVVVPSVMLDLLVYRRSWGESRWGDWLFALTRTALAVWMILG